MVSRFASVIVVALLLAGCISVNPFQVATGEGAFLKNRAELKGESYYLYMFTNATTASKKGWFEPDLTMARDDAVYTIPPGEMSVGLIVYYYPENGPVTSVGEAIGVGFKSIISPRARERVNTVRAKYEIWTLNPDWDSTGQALLRFKDVKGESYRANCAIEEGKAFLWLEDSHGEPVSERVPGYGVTQSNEYFLWVNLPAPHLEKPGDAATGNAANP